MLTRNRRHLLGLVCVVTTSACLPAQPPNQSAEFVLAGYQDGRERLRSGAYKCRGTKVEDDPALGRLEGPVEISGAFDYDANRIRSDRKEPVRVRKPKSAAAPAGSWEIGYEGGTFIKTPQRTVRWLLIDQTAAVVGPATFEPPPQIAPLDIRILGTCTYGNIVNKTPFPEHVRYLGVAASGKVTRTSPTQQTLSWAEKIDESELTFDEAAGFSPVRYEVRFLRRGDNPRPEAFVFSTARWERRNGVWVPSHVFVRDGGKPGRVTSYDLTFEWESVNERLPPEVFSVSGLDLPKGTPVVSNEAGGGTKAVRLGAAGDKDLEKFDDPPGRWGDAIRRWRWPLVAVLAVGAAAAGRYFFYRQRHSLRAPTT